MASRERSLMRRSGPSRMVTVSLKFRSVAGANVGGSVGLGYGVIPAGLEGLMIQEASTPTLQEG